MGKVLTCKVMGGTSGPQAGTLVFGLSVQGSGLEFIGLRAWSLAFRASSFGFRA